MWAGHYLSQQHQILELKRTIDSQFKVYSHRLTSCVMCSLTLPPTVTLNMATTAATNQSRPMTLANVGPYVNQTFSVLNSGPSQIPPTVLTISWPWKTVGSNSYLLYLINVQVGCIQL